MLLLVQPIDLLKKHLVERSAANSGASVRAADATHSIDGGWPGRPQL